MKRIIKFLVLGVFVVVIMSVMGGVDRVGAAESTLVEFNYDASGKLTGEKLVEYGDKDGYSPTNGRGTLLCYMDNSAPRALEWSDPEYNNNGANIVPIVRASIKNKWGNTPSFLISLSTKGYTNIRFSAMLAGSSNGPAQWKLQYSTNGTNFNDIQSSNITIPYDTRKTMTSYYSGFALPDEVSDRDIVYIRIISSSTATVAGGDYLRLPSGGETAINGIRVAGTDIASITTAPAPVTTRAPETTKPAEQNTTAAQPVTTNGGENVTTVKPTVKPTGGGAATTGADNHNTENAGGQITDRPADMSTHIVTQTNASGETITSIVYDETTELLTDENGETITENETETVKESEDESPDEKKSVLGKKKTATSGNIDKESKETSKKDGNGIIVIVILVAVLALGIAAAVIVQKKKSKNED